MTKIDFQNFVWDFFRGFSDFPVEIANISKKLDVSIELYIGKLGKCVKFWNFWKISIKILKNNFRHGKLIFFVQDFFPGKVWSYYIGKQHRRWAYLTYSRTARANVHEPLYFAKYCFFSREASNVLCPRGVFQRGFLGTQIIQHLGSLPKPRYGYPSFDPLECKNPSFAAPDNYSQHFRSTAPSHNLVTVLYLWGWSALAYDAADWILT